MELSTVRSLGSSPADGLVPRCLKPSHAGLNDTKKIQQRIENLEKWKTEYRPPYQQRYWLARIEAELAYQRMLLANPPPVLQRQAQGIRSQAIAKARVQLAAAVRERPELSKNAVKTHEVKFEWALAKLELDLVITHDKAELIRHVARLGSVEELNLKAQAQINSHKDQYWREFKQAHNKIFDIEHKLIHLIVGAYGRNQNVSLIKRLQQRGKRLTGGIKQANLELRTCAYRHRLINVRPALDRRHPAHLIQQEENVFRDKKELEKMHLALEVYLLRPNLWRSVDQLAKKWGRKQLPENLLGDLLTLQEILVGRLLSAQQEENFDQAQAVRHHLSKVNAALACLYQPVVDPRSPKEMFTQRIDRLAKRWVKITRKYKVAVDYPDTSTLRNKLREATLMLENAKSQRDQLRTFRDLGARRKLYSKTQALKAMIKGLKTQLSVLEPIQEAQRTLGRIANSRAIIEEAAKGPLRIPSTPPIPIEARPPGERLRQMQLEELLKNQDVFP